MGLLDDFSQFIKTPEGQGIASAIAGGLANARRGQPWNSIGRAGVSGLMGYSNALDRQAQEAESAQMREYRTMQMEQMRRQAEAARGRQAMLERVFPLGATSGSNTVGGAPGIDTGTDQVTERNKGKTPPQSLVFTPEENARRASLSEQSQPLSQSAAPNEGLLRTMTPDMVAALKVYGDIDLTDVYKLARPNWQVSNGYAVDTNAPGFQGGFQPGVNISNDGKATLTTVGPNGLPVVSAAPGSLQTFGAFEDSRNASSARYKPIKVWNPVTQRDEYVSEEQVTAGSRGQTALPGTSQRIGGNQPLTPELRALILKDAAANGIDNPVTNFTGAGRGQVYGVSPSSAGVTSGGQGFAAGPSIGEKASGDAFGKVNDVWLKSSYEPAVAAGGAASEMLGNIQAARQVLGRVGQTGWGTESKAYAANVLTGLGIGSKNAQMYASNVQQFQNIAMTNLKAALDAAKGPQTEGDAERGAKLFASLQNTPQANEFILDLAEAKAQRDAMRARFYQEALPVARSKGDLQEVDREWQKRSPSIFSMPSMSKWGGKK